MQNGYLIVSIETTTLFQDNEHIHRLFYLTFAQFDFDGNEITKQYRLLKPTDFTIDKWTAKRFNIDQNFLLEEGDYSYTVLSDFENLVKESSLIIGYDLARTLRVLENEYRINGMESSLSSKTKEYLDSHAIMLYCSPHHGLEGIHYYLFGNHFNSSPLDLSIKCFFELKRRKVI